MGNEIITIDWPSLKSGSMIHMRDFPSVRLLKLDNNKAVYYSYDGIGRVVDIKLYDSHEHGEYYYFSMGENDWHPLTSRLWNI